MIGTIICRNCDTAIEVSERDVSTFESQGAFQCPSCKEDLSARMADLLGTARPAPSEERTVPDQEGDAYEGLPVGSSLDDAARAMRASAPAAATAPSSSMGVVPAVNAEDPLTLALRIANQAKEQAEAAMAAAAAAAAPDNSTLDESPTEPTAPGLPSFANGNGADPGVVPTSPDAEETIRKSAPQEVAETELAPDTDDNGPVIGEETPALSPEQRVALEEQSVETDDGGSAIPQAPSAEATPAGRMPAAPREEPTIRKSGPPPALIQQSARIVPRTGTGPSGIGALGFRISNNRAVVRPSFNGRANVAVDTHISGSTSIDRPSVERAAPPVAFERPSRTHQRPTSPPPMPAPATSASASPMMASPEEIAASQEPPRQVLPMWAIGAGVVFVLGVTALFGIRVVLSGPEAPTPIPLISPTPVAVDTVPPAATSTAIAVITVAPAPTPTPAPAVSVSTPAPTPVRTQVAISTQRPTSTPRPSATIAVAYDAQLTSQAKSAVAEGNRLAALSRDFEGAVSKLFPYVVRRPGWAEPALEEEIHYKFCLWSKKLHETKPDKLTSAALKLRYDRYLKEYPKGQHATLVRGYVAELGR